MLEARHHSHPCANYVVRRPPVQGLAHDALHAVWVAPLGSMGEVGPWAVVAGQTELPTLPPDAPGAVTAIGSPSCR